jgi:nitrogen fixation NifU-like protein
VTDLRDLYQELILDHARSPRNFRAIEGASAVDAYNPLCGDHFTVQLLREGGSVRDVAFQGQGCAISTASASVMTEAVKGRSEEEAAALFDRFRQIVTGEAAAGESAGKLAVFAGVSEYPTRVKCATLAWHAMRTALSGEAEAVSTE